MEFSQILKQTITLFKAKFDKNRIHPPVFSSVGLLVYGSLNNRRYGIAIERKLRDNFWSRFVAKKQILEITGLGTCKFDSTVSKL